MTRWADYNEEGGFGLQLIHNSITPMIFFNQGLLFSKDFRIIFFFTIHYHIHNPIIMKALYIYTP